MVGPAARWRKSSAIFLLPLDVRLDYSIALRVFDLLYGRRDLLRGEDEPACVRRVSRVDGDNAFEQTLSLEDAEACSSARSGATASTRPRGSRSSGPRRVRT